MPVGQTVDGEHRQRLVRRVVAVRGRLRFEFECSPRFDYGRAEHTVERHDTACCFALRAARWRWRPRRRCRSATARRGPRSASRRGQRNVRPRTRGRWL